MSDIAKVIILALAAWRLAYMLTNEAGPFGIFAWIRERVGGALECVYCCSVWTAALWVLLWSTPLQPIIIIFAVSGAALMLAAFTGAGVTG